MSGVSFEQLLSGLEKVRQTSSGQWTACCPAHDDRHPSLSIAIGDIGVLLHCFAGCEFLAIVEQLERRDLWPVQVTKQHGGNQLAATVERDISQIMARIDERLKPLARTRADRYLTNRGITVRPSHSETELTYHPSLFHPWSRTVWPALVGTVRNVMGEVVDFHRTWLSIAEPIAKAPVDPVRAWLGSVTGHAVHLSAPAEEICVGEGIETTLSGMQLFGLPGWAALSADNLAKVELPPIVRRVVILIDNDANGTGEHVASAAAWRLRREGRMVEGVKPADGTKDFNVVLQRRGGGR